MEENLLQQMQESKMRKHVTVVGSIHIGFGVLDLIGAVGLFFLFSFLKNVVNGEEIPTMLFNFLSVSIPLLVILLGTLSLVGGIGLLAFKPWARYLIIVVSALGCLNIPIGTLKGVYSLWVLLQDDSIKLFGKN
jgi:uncharacterized membrane protein (DUF2068 family)